MIVRIPPAHNPPTSTRHPGPPRPFADHRIRLRFPALFALPLLAGTARAGVPNATDLWVLLEPDEPLSAVIGPDVGWSEGLRRRPDGTMEVRVVAGPAGIERLTGEGRRFRQARDAPGPGYHTPDDGDLLLTTLADAAPRAGVTELGRSRGGRPILALWLGADPADGAPALRVVAGHHGDEASSWEVALDLAATLAHGDGTDPDITRLLDDATVWIVPFVNPDGAVAGTRHNQAGVDLNRNYDFEWSPTAFASGPAPFSEPESRAIRDQGLLDLPHTSLSLHSGATNIGYVWNYTLDPPPEARLLAALAGRYAAHVPLPGFYVTNGAAWYPTTGDTNDWSYGRYGGMDFTVEVTEDKAPPATAIPSFSTEHRQAQLALLTAVPEVQGTVSDAVTGDPVGARLVLRRGDDPVSRPFYANPTSGRFARHATGATHVEITAPGYLPTRVPIGDAIEVALVPEALEEGTATPWAAPPGETIRVPAAGPVVRLVRPGADAFASVDDGRIRVPDLPPGRYDLVDTDGTTWPGALVVAARHLRVVPDGATVAIPDLPVAPGSRVFHLAGPRRTPVPLPVLDAPPDSPLRVPTPPGAAPHALWIVTGGVHTAVTVAADAPSDTGIADTGLPPFVLERGGCTCGTPRGPGAGLLALLFLPIPLLWRRRP